MTFIYDNCKAFHSMGRGLRSILTFNEFRKYGLVYPEISKQNMICTYLDQKVAYIDNTIEKTKESIEEYKKYKQSLITETVTKGLNPDVKMKDSGIEWIGEIPEHWVCTKVKRILEIPITDGPHETPTFLDDGIPFISAEAVKKNKLNFNLMRGYISLDDHNKFCGKCKPKIHDILMIKSGATTGNIAMVEQNKEFSIWSPLALFRTGDVNVYHKYLFYYLLSDKFKEQVEQFWNYGTQQNIGMGVLGNLFIAFPNIEEQNRISNHLDSKCSIIDDLVNHKEQILIELESYKKSLIFEVVTGKKEIKRR